MAPGGFERKTTPFVAAIIPAYNEGARIGNVLAVLAGICQLSEIIVVDDGSRDKTIEVVQEASEADGRIRLISHPVNLGKGQAVFSGWEATQASHLLLLDADLMGLKAQHVLDLMQPVLAGSADMSIGLFSRGQFRTDLAHWATPWLSGQRCLRAVKLREVSRVAARGYGVETALTVAARKYGWRCAWIPWVGVWHTPSENRRGVWLGFRTRIRMYGQIIHAWYLAGGLEVGRKEKVRSFARDESSEP
jgi:glycosyltransferase involved in cell wall biosynthesis